MDIMDIMDIRIRSPEFFDGFSCNFHQLSRLAFLQESHQCAGPNAFEDLRHKTAAVMIEELPVTEAFRRSEVLLRLLTT